MKTLISILITIVIYYLLFSTIIATTSSDLSRFAVDYLPRRNNITYISTDIKNPHKNKNKEYLVLINENGNSLNRDFEENLNNCYIDFDGDIGCDVTIRRKSLFGKTHYYKRKLFFRVHYDYKCTELFRNYGKSYKIDFFNIQHGNRKSFGLYDVTYKWIYDDKPISELGRVNYKTLINDCKELCTIDLYDAKMNFNEETYLRYIMIYFKPINNDNKEGIYCRGSYRSCNIQEA